MAQLDPELYTIAWIAPLEIEAQAALYMLDKIHEGKFPLTRGDDYVFQAGELCGHNIIIATLPAGQEYGTGSAAALASQVKKFFRNLWFGLLVGVAAGLPNRSWNPSLDIRLGDVLVGLPTGDSAGLIAYDLGKETGSDGFQLLHFGQVLANTETVVRSAIGSIKLKAPNDAEVFLPYYESIRHKEHASGTFVDPGQEQDELYEVDDSGTERLVERERRPNLKRTRVWYGPIGSGEKLMKNARKRNELRDRYNVIGLEMEAAGTMNRIPVGVIRGVCDYGDEHKNKKWRPYAAAMAAAYAKAVLCEILPKYTAPGVKAGNSKREPNDGYLFRSLVTFRRIQMEYLHSEPYTILEEEYLNDETPEVPHKYWSTGIYLLRYPTADPVATINLSVDWNAFDDDPFKPCFKWLIHTPQSLFYPGTHRGQIHFTRTPSIFERGVKVQWISPIFAPFVAQTGALSSDGPLEEMSILNSNVTSLLQSLAHLLAFGPYYDLNNPHAPFKFHCEIGDGASEFFRTVDREKFVRASSFFARAYTVPAPQEDEFVGKGFSSECRETSATALRELLEWYDKDILKDPVDKAWNFENALQNVNSQREWALEERKWADKLIETCGLLFMKRAVENEKSWKM